MGKKATMLYFYVLFVFFTFALAIFTIIVGMGSHNNPNKGEILPLLGFLLPALLTLNFIILLYWAIRWKMWVWIPLIAILANHEYICSMYQLSFKKPQPISNQQLIRIASYNVESFHGDPSIYSVGEVAQLMKEKRVDVVCLQEVAESSSFEMDSIYKVFKDFPYVRIHKNKSAGFNLAVFSKFPIDNNTNIPFLSSDNSAMWVDIRIGHTPVRVFNCHLQTTNFNQTKGLLYKVTTAGYYESKKYAVKKILGKITENAKIRANQADILHQMIDTTKHAILVCGDFNDTPLSYTYYRMKGDLLDGFQSAGSGFGFTFRYLHRFLRIDYIFHSKELSGREYNSPSIDFSDHNPVIMELSIKEK